MFASVEEDALKKPRAPLLKLELGFAGVVGGPPFPEICVIENKYLYTFTSMVRN